MRFKKIVVTALFLFVPLVVFFFALRALIVADAEEEPYSIIILAGQSWAEGTNSFRTNLPDDGNGFLKRHDEPADGQTQFWWAGADGNGPRDFFEFMDMFYSGNSPAGWIQSGGPTATGAQRMQTLSTNLQRGGLFGAELGIGRELYRQDRKKVIILKISYGFQSLAKSSSAIVPYDFNPEPGRNKSYQRMLTEFDALTSYLRNSGKTYTVDGLYWLQGGTDALQLSYAQAYQANFTNFVNAARTDFQMHPSSRIVVGKMSLQKCIENSFPLTIYNYCGFPYAQSVEPLAVAQLDVAHPNFANRMRIVRTAQQTVADSDTNERVKVDIFDMNDIPISDDYIHNSEVGNLEVGRRFVNMYKLPLRFNGSNDYDGDGVHNNDEDTGNLACNLIGTPAASSGGGDKAHNGNLGDDDCDNDGYPNYLDKVNGPGSGLSQ